MFPALLSQAAMAVLPAAAGPLAAVLVPAMAYLITSREIDLNLTVR